MSIIHNERTKLSATYINGIAIAIFAVGGFAPVVSGLASGGNTPTLKTALMCIFCILTSIGLHFIGRTLLKGIKQ